MKYTTILTSSFLTLLMAGFAFGRQDTSRLNQLSSGSIEQLVQAESRRLQNTAAAADDALAESRALAAAGRFEEARDLIDNALQSLPRTAATLNFIDSLRQQRAILARPQTDNHEQVFGTQYEAYSHERSRSRGQLLEEVDQAWRRPKIFERETKVGLAGPGPGLREKLSRIILPRVSFNDVPLSRVIDTLSALSEEYDLTATGVNMVLIDSTSADPAVNLTLRNLGLNRILDFVVESVGYEYDVQDDVIVVRPGTGGPGARLETDFFPISRSTIIRLTGIGTRYGTGAFYPNDPFGQVAAPVSSRNVSGDTERELKKFLQRAGIPFDSIPGADLALADGQLIVTTTPRNLDKVRNLLRRYSEVKQVEIEARFIEVQQSDLNELGINWNVVSKDLQSQSRNRSLASAFGAKSAQSQIIIDGEPVASVSAPNLPDVIDLAEETGNFGTITGILGKYEVQAVLRALSRKAGSDLLSAPKITVLSGKTAQIIVAQELRYPQSYSDINSAVSSGRDQSGGSGVAITAGTPRNFTVRNIGVEMEVTPIVENDNSISLQLEPRVTEFEGFVEYGGPSLALSGGVNVSVPSGFFQPIFSVRQVRTEVTIWDGATVVLGGLTREQVVSVEDRVPILGSIPVLGRFFRSRGESTQKRNLIIFVTANLISPGGSPARQRIRDVEPGSLFQNPDLITPGGATPRGFLRP